MSQETLPAGIDKCGPAVALQCYKILRAADDYATALAKLACSKDRARRMGDSVSRVDAQRKVARDRFAAKVTTILQSEAAAPEPEKAYDWTKWLGGDRPVGECTSVVVILRNGVSGGTAPASRFDWAHTGDRSDIVAYKVADD